ncbi:MAG: ANTAR domain-containing protein [Candidatus Faecousia sp.]|nr:ANTAR domain-containing protein [Candidatus Faecousia sp.]
MAMAKRKYRVLVAGSGDKIFDYISEMLPRTGYESVLRAGDAGEVRRMLLDSPVDIVIINTPLSDDFGVELALDLAEGATGVLLLVKNELYDQVCDKVEDSGVLTLGKPMTRQGFYSAVKLLTAMTARLSQMEKVNRTLQEKMADIRVVNRAKWLLIEHHHMKEQDAHYFIEKQAMDTRLSRREVAENIIRTYDL